MSEKKDNFLKGIGKAIETASQKRALYIEQLPIGSSKFRTEIHLLLSENNRERAFDTLFSITDETSKKDYIDGVLCAGRFLLSNKLIEECYIFLVICQEKVEKVYGEPVDYILFEEIGNMFYFAGLCEEAIKWFQRLMDMNEAPESKMYFSMGMCYQVMNMFDEAIDCYIRSTYADPKYSKSWVNLGYCYIKTNKAAKAIQAFQQLPLSAESLLCLGNAYFHDGNFEEAIAYYLRSIEFKEDPGAYNNLGIALKKVNLLQDAIYAFNDSLSIKPSSEAVVNLLTLYIEVGKKNDAQQLFKSCSHLIPLADSKELMRIYEEKYPARRQTIVNPGNLNIMKGMFNRGSIIGSGRQSVALTPAKSTKNT